MKTIHFSILPAGNEDIPKIQELAYEIWPVYYSSIISMEQIEFMLRRFYNPESLRNQIDQGHVFFMAVENNIPVGFLSLSPQPENEWKLEKLYLLAQTRGKGYGKKMMDFAKDFASKKGAIHLILNVNRFNESRNFYFKLGFSVRQKVDIPLEGFWLNDFVLESKLV